MAVLLALLSSLLWGTSDFTGGTLSRRLSAVTVAGVSELIGLVGLVVVTAALGDFTLNAGILGWGALGAVSGTAGLIAFYQALATGKMGVIAPIAALGVVIPVIVGIAQGNRPSVFQDAGIVIAIIGVVLASGPEVGRAEDGSRTGTRPLMLAVVAACGFGVVFVALAHGAEHSTLMTLIVMRTIAVILILGIALATGPSQLKFATTDVPLLIVVGAFDLGANATFSYASKHGLLAVVSVLSSLYPAVTVVMARSIHAERLRAIQLAGVGAALCGVVLIAS